MATFDAVPEPAPASTRQPPNRVQQLIGPVAALFVGAAILAGSSTIDLPTVQTGLSPRWWPQTLAVTMLGLAVLTGVLSLIGDSTRRASAEPSAATTGRGLITVGVVVAAILGYGALWYYIDFRISTLVLAAALTAICGGRGWRALLVFPMVVTVVIWVLFGVLLRVPL